MLLLLQGKCPNKQLLLLFKSPVALRPGPWRCARSMPGRLNLAVKHQAPFSLDAHVDRMQLTMQLALLISSASAAWMQPPAVHRVAAPATSRQACTFMQAATEVEADASAGEKYEFEAEVTKVMDIIINSLYSDKVRGALRAVCTPSTRRRLMAKLSHAVLLCRTSSFAS